MAKTYLPGEIINLIMKGLDVERGKHFVRWSDGTGTFIAPSSVFDRPFLGMEAQKLTQGKVDADPEVEAYALFWQSFNGEYSQIFEHDCDRDVDEVGKEMFPNELAP